MNYLNKNHKNHFLKKIKKGDSLLIVGKQPQILQELLETEIVTSELRFKITDLFQLDTNDYVICPKEINPELEKILANSKLLKNYKEVDKKDYKLLWAYHFNEQTFQLVIETSKGFFPFYKEIEEKTTCEIRFELTKNEELFITEGKPEIQDGTSSIKAKIGYTTYTLELPEDTEVQSYN
jgi:hypothetical protein